MSEKKAIKVEDTLQKNTIKKTANNTIQRRLIIPLGMCGHNSLFVGQIGDWTWDTVQQLCNVNPYNALNENGEPTYLSFFYYHIKGNDKTHLKAFTIGDEIEVTSKLYRCQDRESLHTVHEIRFADDKNQDSLQVETFNRWISRVDVESNENLTKAAPRGLMLDDLPYVSSENPPWKFYRPALENHSFFIAQGGYTPLIDEEGHSSEYDIDITRDINGVGLLYFASYFTIIDQAILKTWEYLGGKKPSFLQRKIIDQKICYLGNADHDSKLSIKINVWQKQDQPDNYVFNVVISRKPQDKIICVCTTEIIIAEVLGRKKTTPSFQDTLQQTLDVMARTLNIEAEKVDIKESFRKYGLNSMRIVEFIENLANEFSLSNYPQIQLNPATFFEFANIYAIATFLHKNLYPQDVIIKEAMPTISSTPQKQDIAIIGIAGVFPGAKNCEELWQNLVAKRDAITEIPEERWKWQDYFGNPHSGNNKTNSKWGGFIEDVDKFDASFFNISPKEAELMDPQQRIFLEIVWKTIEDAGYDPNQFAGTKMGMFVGVSNMDYFELLKQQKIEAQTATGNALSILANRISYVLDFQGPSESIDTACSSSLVAISNAVRSIQNGQCTMAIAGGINILLTPTLYIAYAKAGMLSPDGRCKTFDADASGYVRGEGAGALLLKPLELAKANGDTIYGVIRGTAVNHGGRANSLTAPNPNAQEQLLIDAYQEAKIDIENINFIEAHGTGTPLGDPIEINALKKAFQHLQQQQRKPIPQKPYCVVSSIKTNIGHLESAAGIAGLIKVLLCIKHKKLPEILHFQKLNPHIDFSESPFYVANNEIPLPQNICAGVSSFGSGGTNAHIVVESIPVENTQKHNNAPQLITISAKNEERLREYVANLQKYLQQNPETPLPDIAYTLQASRATMEERLAIVAENCESLQQKLTAYLENTPNITDCYRGNTKWTQKSLLLTDDEDAKEIITKWVERGKLDKIAKLWIEGAKIDWEKLHQNTKVKRINLPTYPFARERYWVPENNFLDTTIFASSLIHPLLHQNTSDADELRFSSIFTGQEFFLKDHIIKGQKVLPGAYLEMAREMWVKGLSLDWNKLYREKKPQRISLPTYPFARERYWVPENNTVQTTIVASSLIHPLVHQNTSDVDMSKTIDVWISKKKYSKLVEMWAKGLSLDWNTFYGEKKPQRISLPTYPFARERYWVPGDNTVQTTIIRSNLIHPLVHENISDIDELQFTSTFTGQEFFLKDHVVKEQKILPGAAYLEMVTVVAKKAIPGTADKQTYLKNVVWAQPVIVNDKPVKIHTVLFTEENGDISFEVYSGSGAIHFQGKVGFYALQPVTKIEIKSLQEESKKTLSAEQIYSIFEKMGISYGVSHRSIEQIYIGKETVVAKLFLPKSVLKESELFVLHPSIMDGALQASIGFMLQQESQSLSLPFALEELAILSNCKSSMWAIVKICHDNPGRNIQKLDIDICDEDGNICVRIKGFSTRVVEKTIEEDAKVKQIENKKYIATHQNKEIPTNILEEKATNYFKGLLSTVIKLPSQQIDATASMEKYGIDSLMVLELTEKLEIIFGSLSKTLFFEYQSIDELAAYFVKHHNEKLNSLFRVKQQEIIPIVSEQTNLDARHSQRKKRQRFTSSQMMYKEQETDIAIVGLSGSYPQAKNIAEFWENLKHGKDCITEIPKERWDYMLYYDKDKSKKGKSYSKWGGFIDDVDKFDPLFFNISPREAEIMDPQERLFLQCAFSTLEDAGYTRDSLASKENVGVFVGVMYEEYQLYGAEHSLQGNPVALGGIPASIANRVSYYCNFNGPSMTVDTMCSSSLTTIHLACESIKRGECEAAIAGGVNISVHPNKYLMLAQGKFVSSKGRCESFGEGGDGYVPGEGVGAVLLKPLSQAIRDNDHIYGVIKGTAINHGGKTNGYTVPNPNAQATVIGKAFQKSGIDPKTVSYLEAHGTGTSLGDPIEITGLTKAFSEYTNDKQFCAIGSVKSNIGHCESAAGIAGITKVLLQLQHRQLVPSLHSEIANPNINFAETPFVVQQKLTRWETADGNPRIAGISSFGAGGANAHVVIEEYMLKESEKVTVGPQVFAIIVLSAKNEERLHEQVEQIIRAIQEQKISGENLIETAYTLQIGREAMEERLAIIVTSINELQEKLQQFIEKKENIVDLYRGQVKVNKDTFRVFTTDEDMVKTIDLWISKKKYSKLVEMWVKGLSLDWNKLYEEKKPQRISLPTYPFARERYWVPENSTVRTASAANSLLHPLVHQNTSDIDELRCSSIFTGQEFFLKDHFVKEQKVLPGVAYLEMARVAVEKLVPDTEDKQVYLKNVVWAQPVIIDGKPVKIHIALLAEENGEIFFEIYSESDTIHCQGKIGFFALQKATSVDIKSLQKESNKTLTAEQIYSTFEKMGKSYGTRHRSIEQIYVGKETILAKLFLPESVSEASEQFVLHPGIMDGALQSSIGLMLQQESQSLPLPSLPLPFVLEELTILINCKSSMWAIIKANHNNPKSKIQKLDIELCDENGNICVKIKGFSTRVFEKVNNENTEAKQIDAKETVIFKPEWIKQEVIAETNYTCEQHIVMLCELPNQVKNIQKQMRSVTFIELQTEKSISIDTRFTQYTITAFEQIQKILQDKVGEEILVQIVIPHHQQQQLFTGLSGLLKTAYLENPKLRGQIILVDKETSSEDIAKKLKINRQSLKNNIVLYKNNERYICEWKEEHSNREVNIPWKEKGVYLITGGAGGLGFIFAKEIAAKCKNATIILTGRSTTLSEGSKAKIAEIKTAEIRYQKMDAVNKNEVKDLIKSIEKDFGTLSGIIHSAGIIRDNFIVKKTIAEVEEVLTPKVSGVVNLDEASKDIKLDFFITFSSIVGVLGNIGQADYAAANAFMDSYSAYRNELVTSGKRHGKTISINWPLWAEGGMQVDDATINMIEKKTGMIPLSTLKGIESFYEAFSSEQNQLMIISANQTQFKNKLFTHTQSNIFPLINFSNRRKPEMKGFTLTQCLEWDLQENMSKLLKISKNKLDLQGNLAEFGFDSISLTELALALTEKYGIEITPSIFFSYSSIEKLAEYFVGEHNEWMSNFYSEDVEIPEDNIDQEIGDNVVLEKRKRHRIQATKSINTKEPIAIIGMSGRFPQADNIDAFWQNIMEGKDCITSMPKERNAFLEKENDNHIKWGGFIDGIDEFDPLFFKISRKEAVSMSPQERLLLTYSWNAVEDAGYSLQKFSAISTGVFVASTFSEYPMSSTNIPCMIPNRISQSFNLEGPSEYVDTACSSTIVGLHRAIQAIHNNECQQAIVGAVNLLLSPIGFNALENLGFLSKDGKTRSFQQDGNGYVRSEGVGVLIIKPLSQAVKDKDNIYAVIKGTGVVHGGKGLSMTSPSSQGMKSAIMQAHNFAKINPDTISYVETHGTATTLGDSAEIHAIESAFKNLSSLPREIPCSISSIKPCIGHSELVSGMAGIIKSVLAIKNHIIPGIPGFQTLSKEISNKKNLFTFSNQNNKWQALKDEHGNNIPRRCGINNYGISGVNAYAVLEEYIEKSTIILNEQKKGL